MFKVFITHSDELFEFMRISQDDIENGDVLNKEDTLDLHKVMALINFQPQKIIFQSQSLNARQFFCHPS